MNAIGDSLYTAVTFVLVPMGEWGNSGPRNPCRPTFLRTGTADQSKEPLSHIDERDKISSRQEVNALASRLTCFTLHALRFTFESRTMEASFAIRRERGRNIASQWAPTGDNGAINCWLYLERYAGK